MNSEEEYYRVIANLLVRDQWAAFTYNGYEICTHYGTKEQSDWKSHYYLIGKRRLATSLKPLWECLQEIDSRGRRA